MNHLKYMAALGKKGGTARARNLTKKKLAAIGKKGSDARWKSKRK